MAEAAPATPMVRGDGLHAVVPRSRASTARSLGRGALVFVGWAAALAALTWPLPSTMTTHLPHTHGWFVSDLYYLAWALSWQTHALLTHPLRFADGNIYGGAPLALFYGTPGLGLLPYFAPVFAATGNPALALDVAYLAALALTATAIHLVVVAWTRSPLAGVAGAALFVTTWAALDLCGNIPQYAALAATPPIVWLLARERLARRDTVALAALVAVQGATDVVYVALPLFLTLGAVALVRLARPRSRADGGRVAVALVAAGCALLPIYAGYVAVRLANPDLAHQTVWKATRKLWMNMATFLPAGNAPMSLDALAFVPALAGAVVAFRSASDTAVRAWRQAALWFAVSFAISWVIPVAVPAIRDVLSATMIRDITRLGFLALVALCLLVGLGFSACMDAIVARVPAVVGRVVPATCLLVWLATRVEQAPFPLGDYPIAAAPAPGPEAAVLRRGAGPVLELPIGNPEYETESQATAMYRSIAHWRPLLNGYSSYHPRDFVERMNLARQLPAPFALEALRDETGLTTVVVHADAFPLLTMGRWRTAIESGALRGVRIEYADDGVLVAAVAPTR